MIVEAINQEAAIAALMEPSISTRICFSIKPEDQIYRFVKDTIKMTLAGEIYHPVPYAEFSNIASGDGQAADTGTITLDGANIVSHTAQSVDQVLQSLLNFSLRDRPVQIGLIVLNVETMEPIGLIPQFVGFVDQAPFEVTEQASKLDIHVASFRAYAQRRIARTYSDTDHQTRFPGDKSLRWISDAVFRGGKYAWNSMSATGSGAGRGRGRTPGNPGFYLNLHLK